MNASSARALATARAYRAYAHNARKMGMASDFRQFMRVARSFVRRAA